MAVIPQPTSPRLLPEVLRDPRVEPAVRPGGVTLLEAPRLSGDCDCASKAAPSSATPDLTDKVAAYLKARFKPITPLGPPPGDRRLLAEAGVELARFARYPAGITPLGRDPAITSLAPVRSARSPEVLRAIWHRLSLAQAMPEGISPLAAFFEGNAGGKNSGASRLGVSPSAWAAYADAVGTAAQRGAFARPEQSNVGVLASSTVSCECAPRPEKSSKKGTGT